MSVLTNDQRRIFFANFSAYVSTLEEATEYLKKHYPGVLRGCLDPFEPMDPLDGEVSQYDDLPEEHTSYFG